MRIFNADLSRFTTAGYGSVATDEVLTVGEQIAVTDEGADVLAAEVVEVHDRTATIRVRWEEILTEYQSEADGGE